MILKGWEIVKVGESYVAKEFRRGRDGMDQPVNQYTGSEITGPIDNIRETLLIDLKLTSCNAPPADREDVIEIWW